MAAVKQGVDQGDITERLVIHKEIKKNPKPCYLNMSSEHSVCNGLVIAGCS